MPDPPVGPDEEDTLLQCGCRIEEALVEEIFVKLGIIGKGVHETKRVNGWKALSNPERERIVMILEMLGLGINDLLQLVDSSDL